MCVYPYTFKSIYFYLAAINEHILAPVRYAPTSASVGGCKLSNFDNSHDGLKYIETHSHLLY